MAQSAHLTAPPRKQDRLKYLQKEPPLKSFHRKHLINDNVNVGQGERVVSVFAGAILGALGAKRRDVTGLGIAVVGAALAYRGVTGKCSVYKALDLTTNEEQKDSSVHFAESCLINKSPESLYSFWRDFENLPKFMTHLESVKVNSDGTSHWIAKAPSIYGGSVQWDAEIIAEEANSYISWRSLPGGDVSNHGTIKFLKALGDRGTNVRVEVSYAPPFGQLGRWTAKLFGEEPERQIHDDLRRFKRLMELGEIATIEGQSHGSCG